jgi:hypothetical protein
MTREEAERAINAVMSEWTDLTCWGFSHPKAEGFAKARAELRSDGISYFIRAVEWLRHIPRRKTVNLGSYWLKHQAERWGGDYVSNGALIAAAIHLGFKVERISGTPNALINVAGQSKWPPEFYAADAA